MQIHGNSLNYMCDNRMYCTCVEVVCVLRCEVCLCCSLCCSLSSSVCCILFCLCVCILCAYCVRNIRILYIFYSCACAYVCRCMIDYVCICVRMYVRTCVCVCVRIGCKPIRYPPIWLPMRVYGKNY